jgi:hypothetical protein
MDPATHESPRWWPRWGRRREPSSSEPDELVALWKAAWLEGANAAWQQHGDRNPHTDGMEKAAWDAGWKWAGLNPNRRANGEPRFAHPHRRAEDSTLRTSVKRAAAVGATGVTLYAVSRAVRRWMRAPSNGS